MTIHRWLLAPMLLLAACTHTLRYGRAEVQAQLAGRFPVEVRRGLVLLRLSDPQLALHGAQGRVGLRLRLGALGPAVEATGVVEVEGRPDYRPDEGALYLREPVVRTLQLERLSDGAAAALRALPLDRAPPFVEPMVRDLAAYGVAQVLRERPLYVLDPSRSPREARARRHLRAVRVEGDALALEVR